MAHARWPFLDWPHPIPFAHRGGASDAPENTLAAFEYAVGLGYRYVETDVHATADGVLVAFHDDTLDRVTDRQGRIGDLPWDEVRRARVGGTDQGVPLFEDLLGTWPDLRVNVDPKHDAAAEPLLAALDRADAWDRVCVGAFSDRRLARLRAAAGPRLCTSLGPRGVARLRAASLGLPAGPFRSVGCVQVPVRAGRVRLVDARFVGTAHRLGLKVHVWTVDHPQEMTRLLDLGVDGIMTDRPAVLKDVLVGRGCWA